MQRHEFGFDPKPLEKWLEGVTVASRALVDHVVDRVDRLVEDVLKDASEVAQSAADLLEGFLQSLDERNRREDEDRGEPGCARDRGTPAD